MRLTNDMRSEIETRLTEAAFNARKKLLLDQSFMLGVELRKLLITPAQIRAMETLPAKFFGKGSRRDRYTEFGAGCRYAYVKTEEGSSQDYVEVLFPEDLTLPSFVTGNTHVIDPGSFWEKCLAHKEALGDFGSERATFKAQTKGVLSSYNTVEKLLEAWPTIRDVMGEDYFSASTPIQLPMKVVDDLDATLKAGLKKAA